MNPITQVMVREHVFEGPEVTWAGPNPFGQGVCFGFEDGSIETSNSPRSPFAASGEAINGVAGIGKHLAISSRAEVLFLDHDKPNDHRELIFRGGAHGVIAAKCGMFLAPLGPKGILVMDPNAEEGQRIEVAVVGHDKDCYFTKVSLIEPPGVGEVAIFANRRGGFGTMFFRGSKKGQLQTYAMDDLDFIDVCSIGYDSSAALAMTTRAEFMLFRDVLSDEEPMLFSLGRMAGVAYRVLVAGQHLVLLTSKALYIWLDFIAQALKGNPDLNGPSVVLPMEAVDINLLDETYLLIVMASNAVNMIKLDELVEHNGFMPTGRRILDSHRTGEGHSTGEIRTLSSNRTRSTSEFLVGIS